MKKAGKGLTAAPLGPDPVAFPGLLVASTSEFLLLSPEAQEVLFLVMLI